ncbi:MAG TPA: FlgD immunoglobulin-like domain containing protein, partial [Candidatus Eisenbacteria bacterium]|nr:FlgD immunoglobulin-like domain containing protein [Candidatus Eisenbacteria bacterium]
FPMMQFGRAVFAPEYGSIIYWGGGGHGHSRVGNDVWLYDTARNEWRQVTPGDPIESYPNPGLPTPNLGDYCNNDSSFAYFWSACQPTANLPIGSTASGAPWSSHNYSQRAWDSYNRRLVIYGPNYLIGLMPDSNAWFAARASYTFDPYFRSWRFLANNPHLYHQGGAMAFDPVNLRMVAVNHDWWHHAGYNSSADRFNFRWWLDVTTDTWTEKPPVLAPNMFDSDLVYDPDTRKMYRFGGDFPTDSDLWCYDQEEDTWTLRSPIPDPVHGVPPAAAPSAAMGRNGTMLLWGFGGDGECLPTWAYNTRLNVWKKMDAANDPITDAPANDRTHAWASLVYDPTNNVFFLLKIDPQETPNDVGGWPNSLVGQIWVYKHDGGPSATTGVSEAPSPRPHLAQNAPNPFASRTGIAFTLDEPAQVTLTIFDVRGRVVARLADRAMTPGPAQLVWDGRDSQGHAAAAGVYWYQLRAGSFRAARKMVLLR